MIISKKEFLKNKEEYILKIKLGAVFIYPTDTIYGIGCIATNKKSVQKIRKIKQRNRKQFSVIAPSKKWIRKNCKMSKQAELYLKKLPGRYTLILKLNKKQVSPNPKIGTLGIRMPKHWVTKVIKKLKQPIITTSVNSANRKYMTSLKNLEKKIKSNVDFIVYEGYVNKKPSKIINTITNRRLR